MNIRKLSTLLAGVVAVTTAATHPVAAADKERTKDEHKQPAAVKSMPVDREKVNKMIAEWPERPRLGAQQMMTKYGPPQEATDMRLVWHDQGPYKRILVTRQETPHDFPKPHMDYLQHTIAYTVPAGKTDALLDFDGSVTVDRTAGEMSAKCDLEGHNILTLNIAHDIVTGKMSVEEGRRAFGENVVLDMLGKNPPYVMKLQFEPARTDAAFADKPVIPGSPVRGPKPGDARAAAGGDRATMGDAEVLASVIAVNDNEGLAAAEAVKKQVSSEVMAYAKMLQTEHAMNSVKAMKLGESIKVTPVDTLAVDAMRVKGAGELAALVPLDGKEFEQAYLAAMVKGHTEALAMIDDKLLKVAESEGVKKHLTETREHVAAHLEKAKSLQGGGSKQ
jgi:predicted outer membrane protein